MYNKSILMGRLTHNPELKTTPDGVSVITLGIAVERNYQKKGEKRLTDVFNIVAWRNTAEFVDKHFKKGNMILVEGSFQNRDYTDKNGVERIVTELIAEKIHFTGETKTQTSDASSFLNKSPAPQSVAPQSVQGSLDENAEVYKDSGLRMII